MGRLLHRDSSRSRSNTRRGTLGSPEAPLLGSASHIDSDFVESDSDTSNIDEYDPDDENKALITEYLNDPPSLHVRR